MKTSWKILLAAAALSTASLAATAPASAQPTSFSFRVGDVAFGYSDGYYDRYHNWHAWRNAREHNWYRANYGHSYRGYHHRGWRRDSDRDGIPNRFDRDRDNDGVPNWADRRPRNPYRD
jgi:hypothetical protein